MLLHLLKTVCSVTLDLVFPPRCEVCGTLQEPVICDRCVQTFSPVEEPICRQCGVPLDPLAKTSGHCADCLDDPPTFDAARSAGLYADTLRHAIHIYKYRMARSLANPLGDFIAASVQPPFPVDLLCPVPLHPARERMRGFNQSLLLAERLGANWQLPVEAALLARIQNTQPQMKLPPDQRRQNVKGAFTCDIDLRDRSIGLLDDVFTTGSTLRECSRVLKRAGAARVFVITLARAISSERMALMPADHTHHQSQSLVSPQSTMREGANGGPSCVNGNHLHVKAREIVRGWG